MQRALASTCLLAVAFTAPALAQTRDALGAKLDAAIECSNRQSQRAYQSRERYFSWAARSGPTGKERIIYGTYTIYDTADCRKKVAAAAALEPREPALEAASAAYVDAVSALEPLLKEADDYYDQQNYKDDKMAKGRALHPRLVAAWDAFASADRALRAQIDGMTEKRAADRLVEIEQREGRKGRWHIEALMIDAKRLIRVQSEDKPDLPRIQAALGAYEELVKATEAFATANPDAKVGSSFISASKSFLTTSKALMRRVRDKVPYSQGERMLMTGGGGGWMVEGSPARLTRDYNQLVDSYNRGASF
jgi:hypothetical protein